ncbi:DUF1320 domain-containing protein [Granulicella sp. WH15]|uniref:gp436 family protein n=1 Tax=Granulicella sp. WH15 TaxID=2602070 RepID=UPI001366EF21|nr:DUF1320 domain-containing protein [Granulicella sp. WH15]QHN04423.1 DUF1320 domain-containing protein [Granulicella sp. WH15]
MAYAAQSDLVPGRIQSLTLAQLTGDGRPPEIDPGVVSEKLDEASGQVELYCRLRYKLPLQPTNELVGLTCTIAIYLLYSRRTGPIPEAVTNNYQDAMKMLRDISAGKASLDQPIGTIDQASSGPVVRSTRPNKFSDRNLRGFE